MWTLFSLVHNYAIFRVSALKINFSPTTVNIIINHTCRIYLARGSLTCTALTVVDDHLLHFDWCKNHMSCMIYQVLLCFETNVR